MASHLTDRMVVPIANETDAERTCDAIERELSGNLERSSSTIVAVHVIEKGDGAPDKAPMEARTEQAERIFEVVTDRLESDRCRVETELVYGTDIVDTLRETAEETNATSIVFFASSERLLRSLPEREPDPKRGRERSRSGDNASDESRLIALSDCLSEIERSGAQSSPVAVAPPPELTPVPGPTSISSSSSFSSGTTPSTQPRWS